MKIAIISSFGHMECLPFILEIYKNANINIDVYINKDTDKHNWTEYCLTIFNFNVIYNNINKDILNNYNKIIKITSSDRCLDDKQIVSILHIDFAKCKSEKYISLTPYINGNDIYYTFPIYHPIVNNYSKNNKIITMIGYYKNKSIDEDLLNFININNNYTFNFIIWGDIYKNLKGIKNVHCYTSIKTNIMIDMVHNSKYILSKKYINYDRFSGQLGIAISHEIPLIIDIKTKNNYKLPGITFNENYSDIDNLDDITDEQYSSLKKEIKLFKDNILENNKIIFDSL